MTENDQFADLPEDPELQFMEVERRLRKQMWDNLRMEEANWPYERDQKIYYMTKLMAVHDAFQLSMLTRPSLPRRADDFNGLFDEFLDEVTYWTTQIEVRERQRSRRVRTILALPDNILTKYVRRSSRLN